MTMKLLNKLRSITHTLSMGMLFKPHQDPTVCPEHGPMAGITGRANPDIDPDNEWDTIYYCPKCLHEELEAEKKALPFKDREPKLMRGIFEGRKACKPWVSPHDSHVTSDPQTYTGEDLLELGIEGGDGPQPLRLCGFCKSQLPDIEYHQGINFAWLPCPECKADNWVGGHD